MRGWAVMPLAIASKDQVDAARPLFEQALRIDPDNSEALAGKATTTLFEYIVSPKADVDYDAAILGLVDKAIALDPGNIHAYRTKGQYLGISGRPEDAVRALDAGLTIDPSAAGLLAQRANAEDLFAPFRAIQIRYRTSHAAQSSRPCNESVVQSTRRPRTWPRAFR